MRNKPGSSPDFTGELHNAAKLWGFAEEQVMPADGSRRKGAEKYHASRDIITMRIQRADRVAGPPVAASGLHLPCGTRIFLSTTGKNRFDYGTL